MKKLIVLSIAASLVTGSVFADISNPYIGVGGSFVTSNLNKDDSAKIFAKNSLRNTNIRAGVEFFEVVGVEIGLESQAPSRKNTDLVEGDKLPGADKTLAASEAGTFNTKFKAVHPYMGITQEFNVIDKVHVNVLVGASYSMINARQEKAVVSSDSDEVSDKLLIMDDKAPASTVFEYSKNKVAPMMRVGLRQELTENVSLNGNATFRILNTTIKDKNNEASILRVRNTLGFGLGLSYYFA